MVAVVPSVQKTNCFREIPPVYLALTRPSASRWEGNQVVPPVHAADCLPETCPGILVAVDFLF